MARLGETVANLVGKVEIFARGADELRRATEQALESRRPAQALRLARRLKDQAPDAALALALWADAAAACGLDEEQCEALEALARQVPWRAELWLRVGQLAAATGRPTAREALERAACAPGDAARVRAALLALCDLDLATGEAARALRWLDRMPAAADGRSDAMDAELGLRIGECAVALGRWDRASGAAARLGPVGRSDGRDRLLLANVLERSDEPAARATAAEHALAALVVGARGAEAVLLRLLTSSPKLPTDATHRLGARARAVLCAGGHETADDWQAAMLWAEGRAAEATALLRQRLAQGHPETASLLLSIATQTEDLSSLSAVAERQPSLLPDGHRHLYEAARCLERGHDERALGELGRAASTLPSWADALADRMLAGWLPALESGAATQWSPLLRELRAAARVLDDATAIALVDAIAQEQSRPLQVALVGEFNAGKSTLVNAWLGAAVAPTGVLPTTQSVHRVAWAPEPFVRIVVVGQSDRIVSHEQLPRALAALDESGEEVAEVLIYAPLEPLRRVELLDTPGLNAPDHRGRELTLAAVREAHLALWLLDATTPLKETERRSMAEVTGAGVPIQILVNKLDRLAPEERSVVLQHVDDSLRSAAIRSYRPPLGLSATLALRARLGDDAARAASNFDAFVALLETHVFDRALVLRERALRRKGGQLARRLLEAAERQARSAERARAEREALEQALGRVARRLEQEPGLGTRRILPALRAPTEALELDMRPMARLGRRHLVEDPEVRSYVVERTVERLARPLADAIASWIVQLEPALAVTTAALTPLLEPGIRAALGGVVCALDEVRLEPSALARIVEAAIRSSAWELDRRSSGSERAPEVVDLAWRLDRLARRLER